MVSRGDVWLVLSGDNGEPQPCVVLSPPEIHDYLSLVTVAPLSRDGKAAAYRVPLDAAEARGVVHLEQIRTVEKRQGLSIGCPEEVAWRMGFLNDEELRQRAEPLVKSGYGGYLLSALEQGR